MSKKIIYLDDAIDAIEKSRFPGAPYVDTGILIALREIKALPSAQSELTEEEWRQIRKLRSFHNGTYAKVLDKLMAFASAQPTPCDVCRHNPPSSMDGKPCCVCPAEGRTE